MSDDEIIAAVARTGVVEPHPLCFAPHDDTDWRALADDAAALLKLAKARRPTLTLADIEGWMARYREARRR